MVLTKDLIVRHLRRALYASFEVSSILKCVVEKRKEHRMLPAANPAPCRRQKSFTKVRWKASASELSVGRQR